jgi:hypothetical protein
MEQMPDNILKFAPARNAGPGALADGASNSLPSFHDRTRRAIEARLASPVRPTTVERLGKTRRDHREARHITIRPVHPVADWLERTFADRLGWFIATLFPLCVAAFAVGYFGLRELLAGFGL